MKPEIGQRELGFLLGTSKQALAELLAKLESSGFVAREPSKEDRRAMTIRLTDEGESAAARAADRGKNEGAQDVFDCLNEEELNALSGYLGRIIERCEEGLPGEPREERRKAMAHCGCGRCHGRDEGGRGRGFPRGPEGE
jgi:DNA-binding MarR family transcriptional regulator